MADTADTPAPSYGAALQLQVRRARAFSDVEQSLPAVSQHRSFFADAFSSPLDEAKARTMAGTLRRAAAELLSHLGPWNPKPLPVEDGSVVWLLDNTAFRAGSGDGTWKAEFVTAVFAPRRSLGVADAATNIARRLGIEDGAAEIEIIHQRLLPFVLAIQPGRLVEIEFAGRADVALGPCGRNGISSDVKMVPEAGTGRVVESVAKGLPADVTGLLRMKTAFAEEKGWAVISGRPVQDSPSRGREGR